MGEILNRGFGREQPSHLLKRTGVSKSNDDKISTSNIVCRCDENLGLPCPPFVRTLLSAAWFGQ